ncbi:MAG: hypothetical protein GWN00_05150 [Aliifodinibius sp.]|nr:hypothetical protein [Fodinibius sp.]NIV10588.1 hypothetical protein [Fodinibius sp.]NIY24216.1 hypothetical protein [Fodinibius sp.]
MFDNIADPLLFDNQPSRSGSKDEIALSCSSGGSADGDEGRRGPKERLSKSSSATFDVFEKIAENLIKNVRQSTISAMLKKSVLFLIIVLALINFNIAYLHTVRLEYSYSLARLSTSTIIFFISS